MVTIHFFVKAALVVIFDSLTPNTVQIKLNEINYFCSEKMLKDIGSTRWILQESFLGCSYIGEYVWNYMLVYSPTKKFSPTYFTKTHWFFVILFTQKYSNYITTADFTAPSNKRKLFENIWKNFRDTEYHQIDEDFKTAVKLFDNLQMEANGLRRLLQS